MPSKLKRKCKACNRTKGVHLFSYRKWTCNKCFKETPAYRRQRDQYLLKTYGITADEYEQLLECSGGWCWICGGGSGGKQLAVDHDHETGQIRGLLCKRCNSLLARIHNRVDIAESMGWYLTEAGDLVNRKLDRITLAPDAVGVAS